MPGEVGRKRTVPFSDCPSSKRGRISSADGGLVRKPYQLYVDGVSDARRQRVIEQQMVRAALYSRTEKCVFVESQ